MTEHCCGSMTLYLKNEDGVVMHWKATGEYLIPVHDGGNSGIVIRLCHWCGKSLATKGSPRALKRE